MKYKIISLFIQVILADLFRVGSQFSRRCDKLKLERDEYVKQKKNLGEMCNIGYSFNSYYNPGD